MPITLDGGAGVTYPDGVQQTNAVTNTGGSPAYYAARAWVNINGITAAIRASVNVASVTSPATGRYVVTFATNMPDANYTIVATAGDNSTTANYYNARIYGAPTTNSFVISVTTQSSGNPVAVNVDYLHVVVFR
jgi:hypothetical protein